LDLIEFAKTNNFTMLFVIAAPVGAWCGRHDLLINEDDSQYIKSLKEKYPFIHRDLYPIFGFEWGCRTVNGLIYVTPSGDVLPCPFIHIKLGNIHESSLHKILENGWKVKYFRDYNEKCLVGEHTEFINRIIPKYAGKSGAIELDQAFDKTDFYTK
jgi:MoaA/NifB/PqqE/SkfB family radical SAM enzyme